MEEGSLSRDAPRRRRGGRRGSKLAPVAALGALAILWELTVQLRLVSPVILPSLSVIAADFVRLPDSPIFLHSLALTLFETITGFAFGVAIGLVIGVFAHSSSWFQGSVMPYVVMLQSMPRVALAPLFLIWFGFGVESKIAVAAAVCFFPVAINTAVGLNSAEDDQVLLMRSLGASHVNRIYLLTAPSAAPFIFAGVKTAIALALTGAIVGEYISSSAGLGFMIASATFSVDIPRVFSLLAVLAMMGGLMFWSVDQLDRRVVFWRTALREG